MADNNNEERLRMRRLFSSKHSSRGLAAASFKTVFGTRTLQRAASVINPNVDKVVDPNNYFSVEAANRTQGTLR
jgi:hypothetical protein